MGLLKAKATPGKAKSTVEFDDYEGYEVVAARMRVILPSSWFRATWDWFLITFVLYNLVVIPLEICFLVGKVIPIPVRVLNIIVDTFFIVDVGLNFRTAYYDGMALSPVIEPALIAQHYLFGPSKRGIGWFWPDCLAAIPFDWVPSGTTEAVEALSIAKLGRLFRLGRLIKKLDQFTAARAVRVVNMLIAVLLFTHFFACIWWKVGMDTSDNQGWPLRPSVASVLLEDDVSVATDDPWLYYEDDEGVLLLNRTRLRQRIEEDVSIAKKYITSLYWALTMVMKSPWIGPHVGNEQVFACFTVVGAAMLFAAFIGNFTTAIASYDKSNAIYRDSTGVLRLFFKMRPHISTTTKRKAFRYADAYFKQTIGGTPELSVLSSMPEHLRPAVLLELHAELLTTCTWLQETSFACCCDFLQSLRPEILLRGDALLRAGVISRNFYIHLVGELKVLFPPEGGEVSKLGAVLGEGSHAITKANQNQRSSQRVPQNRIERLGSLIGWGPPHGVPLPLAYTAIGARDTSLLSITRVRLAEILDTHPLEAATFMRASEHAAKLINPIKKGAESADTVAHRNSLAARRRCSTLDAMKQDLGARAAGLETNGNRRVSAQPMSTSPAKALMGEEDVLSMQAAAREAGWLSNRPAQPPAATSTPGVSGSEMSADDKFTRLLEEIASMKQAIERQAVQIDELHAENARLKA